MYRSDFVGYADAQEREAVSEIVGYSRSHLWAIAVLVAFSAFSLSSRGVLSSHAADEPPPPDAAEESAKDDDNGDQPDSTDETADESASSQDTEVEEVSEETDSEVEVEPDEEKSKAEPAQSEAGEEGDAKPPEKEKRIIGATATVLEKQSNLLFRARVDTGAKSCSLHVEEISIDDEEEKWVDNIGKVVRFKVKNRNDESHWLEARIDGYVIIKTSGARTRRYKVPLTLRWKGVEKTVLVTLNDRDGMDYPLLLGRNFLRGDFVVDVDVDNDD